MDPITIVALLTAAIPFITKGVKKLIEKRTAKLDEPVRKGVHTLIPIVLGVLSSGLYSYAETGDWVTAMAVGLGSGGAASSLRDIDKNLLKVAEAVGSLLKNR